MHDWHVSLHLNTYTTFVIASQVTVLFVLLLSFPTPVGTPGGKPQRLTASAKNQKSARIMLGFLNSAVVGHSSGGPQNPSMLEGQTPCPVICGSRHGLSRVHSDSRFTVLLFLEPPPFRLSFHLCSALYRCVSCVSVSSSSCLG